MEKQICRKLSDDFFEDRESSALRRIRIERDLVSISVQRVDLTEKTFGKIYMD